jgi:hypothetical protein
MLSRTPSLFLFASCDDGMISIKRPIKKVIVEKRRPGIRIKEGGSASALPTVCNSAEIRYIEKITEHHHKFNPLTRHSRGNLKIAHRM